MFFDDVVLLRTIDRLEQAGHTGELNSATSLLNQVTDGQPVIDERDLLLFLREMEMAQASGYVDFRVIGWGLQPPIVQQMGVRNYLAQMTDIHLLPPGRDRRSLPHLRGRASRPGRGRRQPD